MRRESVLFAIPVLIAAGAAFAQPSDAADPARCVELAGAPDAGVPPAPQAFETQMEELARARPHCAAAVEADPDDGAALFHLAHAFERDGDHAQAVGLYRRAAAAGVVAAETRLGDYFNFGLGPVAEDHAKAVEHYDRAARQGDLAGKTTLAFMHMYGRGVPRDAEKTIALMSEAAKAGYHYAQYRLAQILQTGEGVPQDMARAQGIPDLPGAEGLYRAAAEQDNVSAQLALASLYATGEGAVSQNPEAQARWTRRAAETGLPKAQAALGLLYEQGRGVERSPERAAELYVAALKSGRLDLAGLRAAGSAAATNWDRETAMAFQRLLRERGLYQGSIDGIVGPGTSAAAAQLAD